jgi:hypothetical protein
MLCSVLLCSPLLCSSLLSFILTILLNCIYCTSF